jgi:hypothetical protein
MESSSIIDYCSTLKKIPQFSSTCWFNSILIVMLYSEGFRRCIAKHFNNIRKPRNDKLLTFLLYMIKSYNNIDQLEKVYKSFKDYRLKPEYILLSYLTKYDELTKNIIKNNIKKKLSNFGYQPLYITNILKNYNIPYINLIKSDNNIFINLKNNKKITTINLNNINDQIYSKKDFLSKLDETNILILNINNNILYDFKNVTDENDLDNYSDIIRNYSTVKKDINTIKEEISINNHIFKLDSCIITNNYSEIVKSGKNNYHAIACINCNKNKYIIDSRNNFVYELNKYFLLNKTTFKEEQALLKYDWLNTLTKNYTFYIKDGKKVVTLANIMGTAISLNKDIYSYNLETSSVIFFYIKKNITEMETSRIKIEKNSSSINSNISTKKLNLSSRSILKNINSLYNFESLTTSELLDIISDNNIAIIPPDINIKENYKYLYYYLFNINIDTLKSNDILLREVIIKIIKLFLSKRIHIKLYSDEFFFNLYITDFNNRNISDLIKIIKTNTNTDYTIDYFEKNVDYFTNLLFVQNAQYYDKFVLTSYKSTNNYKNKQVYLILVRVLIDIIIFKIDFNPNKKQKTTP